MYLGDNFRGKHKVKEKNRYLGASNTDNMLQVGECFTENSCQLTNWKMICTICPICGVQWQQPAASKLGFAGSHLSSLQS